MPTPEVRVRLSAEGQQEIISAFRRVEAEGRKAGRSTKKAFDLANASLRTLRGLLPALSVAFVVRGLQQAARAALDFADAMGKSAQKVGTTVDLYSVLAHSATFAGASHEQLETGLLGLARALDEVDVKGSPAADALTRIGLTSQDLEGLDLGEKFVLIAKTLGSMENSGKKTRIAMDLLSESGAHLIPLMNDLAREGFDALAESAERAGTRVTEAQATIAQEVNDAFTQLGNELQGITLQFLEGFLPPLLAGIEELNDAVANDGSTAWREFGKQSGAVLVTTIEVIGQAKDGFLALAEIIEGRFLPGARSVSEIWTELAEKIEASRNRISLIQNPLPKIEEPTKRPGQKDAPESSILANLQAERQREAEARKAEAERQRAARRAEAEARKAAAAADAERREQEAASAAIFNFELQLAQTQQERHEAAIRNLRAELAEYEESLRVRGDGEDEIARKLARANAIGEQRVAFDDLRAQADEAFSELSARRAEIDEQVLRGQITTFEGEAKIVALDKDRLVNLEAIAQKMQEIAASGGDLEQIQAARDLAAAVGQVRVEADKAGREWAEFQDQLLASGEFAFAGFFDEILSGTASIDEAFQNLTKSIAQSFQRLIAQKLAEKLFEGLAAGGGGILGFFGFGEATKKAQGGMIHGPGTGTSDSIPALLSDGEYVVRASAVSQPGVRQLLDDINQTKSLRLRGVPNPVAGLHRYAAGGLVESVPKGGGQGAGTLKVEFGSDALDITLREGIERYLASKAYR